MIKEYIHTPVLLSSFLKVINDIDLHPNKAVDATLGGGGYSKAILNLASKPQVLSIDLDNDAIENARNINNPNLHLMQGNFANISEFLNQIAWSHKIDLIVADLGMSNYQLTASGRGITFQSKEPLDMRFDISSPGLTASHILNYYNANQLTQIFTQYGEEPFANKIANEILKQRENGKKMQFTDDMVELIQSVIPKRLGLKWKDSVRRVFQALRIEVNSELSSLEKFLPDAYENLTQGGVLAIITFHSLEDRIVKHFFQKITTACICPRLYPICVCNNKAQAKLLTKKLIKPTEEEIAVNSKSKSALLRIIQKN